jgi:hypothetical protein
VQNQRGPCPTLEVGWLVDSGDINRINAALPLFSGSFLSLMRLRDLRSALDGIKNGQQHYLVVEGVTGTYSVVANIGNAC